MNSLSRQPVSGEFVFQNEATAAMGFRHACSEQN